MDHYFTQTFALAESEEIAIATVTLQIFSHNLKRYLMKALQTVIKDSQLQVNIHYPQVHQIHLFYALLCHTECRYQSSIESLSGRRIFTR